MDLLYAISIVANPDIVTPQALKKATDYLKRPKTLCPEFFGANTKMCKSVVSLPVIHLANGSINICGCSLMVEY